MIRSALVMLVVALMAYANSFPGTFAVDDLGYLNDNMKNPALWPQDWRLTPGLVCYRPLMQNALRLINGVFNGQPFAFHAVNVVLLAMAGWLIFIFCRAAFGGFSLGLLAGVLWIVHPLNGICVNYATATGFLMQVIFMLLSLYVVLTRYQVPFEVPLALLFFCLALLCHETAVLMPVYVFALSRCLGRGWRQSARRSLPFVVLAFVYILWRLSWPGSAGGWAGKYAYLALSPLAFSANLLRLIGWYLAKLVFPVGIVVTHALIPKGASGIFWLEAAAVAALMAWLLRRMKDLPAARCGLAWLASGFLILPVACLVEPSRGMIIEPYWFVFSGMGFFMIAAALLSKLLRQRRVMALGLSLLVIGLWASVGFGYNALWRDPPRLYDYWLQSSPAFTKVNCYLGGYYQRQGRYDLAAAFYELCLTRHSGGRGIYYLNLGVMDVKQGRYDDAEKNLRLAIQYDPSSLSATTHLGVVAFARGNIAQAKKFFVYAMDRDPMAILPRLNMGSLLTKEGDLKGARAMYRQILAVDPHHDIALVNLFKTFLACGNSGDICAALRQIAKDGRNPRLVEQARRAAQSAQCREGRIFPPTEGRGINLETLKGCNK